MSNVAEKHFVELQGVATVEGISCARQFSALMIQPKLIAVLVAAGLVTQSGLYFLALSALLWWNAILPALNPIDAAYNRLVAGPRGYPRLGPAPAPRRFAQGMAATFLAGIGISLMFGATILAWALEGFIVLALLSLVVGRFCVGSYVYHVATGNRAFANRTLPWS